MTEPIHPDIVNDFEHATWSRCAGGYLDHFAGLTGPAIAPLITRLKLKPGMTALDLGCGPGNAAAAMVAQGATVSGIDFSADMIVAAKQHCPQANFVQGNAEQLPFEDEAFDAVMCNFVAHHLARPDVVFNEVRRTLKPGGVFAFAVFGQREKQSSIGAFMQAVGEHHDIGELPHGPLFGQGAQAYTPMLEASGLSNATFESFETTWHVDDNEQALRAFVEWGNIEQLPNDVQRKIRQSTSDNMQPFENGSGYSFPHEALLGSAVKPHL